MLHRVPHFPYGRLVQTVLARAKAVPSHLPRIGRPAFSNATFALWPALDALGVTAHKLAADLEVAHQQFSAWTTGKQWAPLTAVRHVERMTNALPERFRVRLGHWPKVRDRETGKYWRFGQRVNSPWRENLMKGKQ